MTNTNDDTLRNVWKIWCKAIGQKAFQDDLRADRVAVVRTVWVVLHIVTCFFIIAHNGFKMNMWSL